VIAALQDELALGRAPKEFLRCAAGLDIAGVCEGLADDLVEAGFELPSIYLMTGDRLRCRAARGYFQVVDGFSPGTGVIGRVVATGRESIIVDVAAVPDFIAAISGVRSEACVPVLTAQGVVGAVNVESRIGLDTTAMPILRAAAALLARRIDDLGGLPAPSQAHRLGQVSVAMTSAASIEEIESLCVRAAVDLSGIGTAAMLDLGGRQPVVSAAVGPLAEQVCGWESTELATMAGWVTAGTSSYFPGGETPSPDYAFLERAQVRALSVHPLLVGGRLSRLLVLASSDSVAYTAGLVEVLEVLAAHTAATVGVATAMAELARRVDQDGLTGLRNAAAFAADVAEVRPKSGLALVLVDVDHFKGVNDSFGHLAGDRLLQSLAGELTQALRGDDRLYRIGGDEFAAVVTATSPAELEAVSDRLLRAARQVRTTVSIGTAPFDSPDCDLTRTAADVALYRAKADGRDVARHSLPQD
jgi:diguanylate cyclase (GGDEF)-like protein